MYNNLTTYNYDDIFNKNQLIISKKIYNIHNIHFNTANNSMVDNLVDHIVYKMTSISTSISTSIFTSDSSETLYKTYVMSNNNNFKEYIIISYILEIYYTSSNNMVQY